MCIRHLRDARLVHIEAVDPLQFLQGVLSLGALLRAPLRGSTCALHCGHQDTVDIESPMLASEAESLFLQRYDWEGPLATVTSWPFSEATWLPRRVLLT
jgi:hypothetical protein